MKKLLASMQNELTKLTSQKKYWVFPLIAAIAVVGFPLLGLIPGNVLQLSMSNYPYTVLSIVGYLLLPIIAFMMAADLLAGEEERGELKISLTYPISRTAILLGKLFAMIIYSAVLILAFIILAVIVSLFIGGFGAISLLTLLAAYCITLLPIFMVCSFALAVSTFVRTSTASFVVCLLGYIGISALGLYFSSLAVALPTNYMTIYKMILGSRIPWSNLATGSLILIGYTIVFASIANMRFAKKEV